MSPLRLILLSLRHHARAHLAVMLGVAAGTAVLTGALLVGDSVRGSLRDLTLDRLGRVDTVLVADRFFRQELAAELRRNLAATSASEAFTSVQPALLIAGTVESPDRKTYAQATLLGIEPEFWSLAREQSTKVEGRKPLARREIVLNRPLADELGVEVGDDVLIRLRLPSDVPTESALGRKEAEPETSRMVVADIVPAEGLGRFGLSPNQQLPHNAFLSLAALQAVLEQDDRANVLLVAGAEVESASPPAAADALTHALRPQLADLGATIAEVALPDAGERYFSVGSDRMLLSEYLERRALEVFAAEGAQPVFAYLANTIARADGAAADAPNNEAGSPGIPYSTISALDLSQDPPFGPFVALDGAAIGSLADDEIVLNDWAAGDLDARPGDAIRVAYFEPESTHGETHETSATFKLKAIARLAGPAADRLLTPEVKGVTDEESIANWDPPFPYDGTRIRDRDEAYWDEHRATPKAFVSLVAGRKLWSSRFGQSTSIRIPAREGMTVETVAERLSLDPARMGLSFQPVKRQGLMAASGTTPFGLLFLGFSFFIVAAAVMLVALLFRLGIERRAREVGILLATGVSRRQTLRLLAGEGFCVSALGGLLGAAWGVGYAWLMLAGLRTWWLAAVTAPFLRLHLGWESVPSLAIGYVSGVAVSLLAIWWAAWRMKGVPVRRLLANQSEESRSLASQARRWPLLLAWGSLALALVVGGAALRLSGEAQAGAFFGSGALVLTAGLMFVWRRLKSGTTGSVVSVGGAPLARLAVRNGARNPGRSALTIGLVASATFLIVAISAFRLAPSDDVANRDSGSGGFSLVAESASPLLHDLNTAAGRRELGISSVDERQLTDVQTHALRVRPGEDASCLNLYRTAQPRILGASQALLERGGFAWGPTAAETAAESANPWLMLLRDLPPDAEGRAVLPVALDANTATYSLRKGLGDELLLDGHDGEQFVARIVGLLKNSLFQGDLVTSEAAFVHRFPDQPGFRFFLIESPADRRQAVTEALESGLRDQGFDVQTTQSRLAGFMAVQNTYLSTFQSLGGLGLLLGTFGLAAVQLRNVLERRGELALLRAVGFRRGRLARLVTLENVALLVGGLALGVVAALVAVLPHLLSGGAAIPWGSLAVTLGAVLAAGLLAGLFAVRATLRAPLLPALRGE